MHPLYTPHTPLYKHPLYTPHTPLIHPSYTPNSYLRLLFRPFKRADTVNTGEFLWENIYPKGADGLPAVNPSGHGGQSGQALDRC